MMAPSYIEAILADRELADRVWFLWQCGQFEDSVAELFWVLISIMASDDNYDAELDGASV